MNIPISTTPEQSERLLKCGITLWTADMCFITYPDGKVMYYVGNMTIQYDQLNSDGKLIAENGELVGLPSWSLSALLSMLPQRLNAPHADTPCDFLLHHRPGLWLAMYHDGKKQGDAEDYVWQCITEQRADNPIECCVKMVEWLTSNNYKLNIYGL